MGVVCAGRRNKVALGDVVAADRLYYHDTGKQLPWRVEQDLTTYKLHDDWKIALERVDPTALFGGEAWFLSRPLTTEWRVQRVLVNIGNSAPEPWGGGTRRWPYSPPGSPKEQLLGRFFGVSQVE